MTSKNQQKLTLVFLALALAAVALYLQSSTNLEVQGFRGEALFRSESLGDAIPLEALLVKVRDEEVQRIFNYSLTLESVAKEPTLVTVSFVTPSADAVEGQMKRVDVELNRIAKALLSAEARELSKSLKAIDEPQIVERKKVVEKSRRPALSGDERRTALRLDMEKNDLLAFLDGGAEPTWLSARLDPKLYARTEGSLIEAEGELRRLRETFTSRSRAIEAQSNEVARLREIVHRNKLHLAKALLKSHKHELSMLDEKALGRIKENVASSAEYEAASSRARSTSEVWVSDIATGLDADIQSLEALAAFHRVSEVRTVQIGGGHYWMRLALWLSAAVVLLMALFKPESVSGLSVHDEATQVQLSFDSGSLRRASSETSFQPEPLLAKFLSSVKNTKGDAASALMVLGASRDDSRPIVTVRLAKTLSGLGKAVRLVDFDLQEKLLSKKLGNEDTAGISDLLASKCGPAEEFLAPLSGTDIEFAPAGISEVERVEKVGGTLDGLLLPRKNGVLVIDAAFSSPIAELLNHVEAVVCVTAANRKWNEKEQRVLLLIREANKPIWGFVQGDQGLYPFT